MQENNSFLVPVAVNFVFDETDDIILSHINKVRLATKRLPLFLQAAFGADKDMSPKKLSSKEWLIAYNNNQFFHLFRMQKRSVDIFMGLIVPLDSQNILNKKYTGGHYPIPFKTQVLIYLWYMGTQDTLLSIGTQFKVSLVTVMMIVNRLLYFVIKLKRPLVRWPMTEQGMIDISNGFRHYPGTGGACDGTLVKVTIGKDQQDSYIDRYRQHSINMMLVSTAERLITYFFIGFPGSAHDSRVLENSPLVREIERSGPNTFFFDDTRYHLIGDRAFALKTWMMTPYKDNGRLTQAEKLHNRMLSSDRVVAEHTNALVKLRWARLKHINTYNISKSVEIATSACVLHNFCLLNQDYWPEEGQLRRRNVEEAPERPTIQVRAKRDAIRDRLFQEYHY